MPWGRLDDSLYDHPKLDLLPADRRLEAIGLWARAISWCNRFLTDGHVPRERIAKLDGTAELADMLVAADLFELNGSGYLIHDFLEFNDSREQVESRRVTERNRKAAWREHKRSGGPAVSPSGTSSVVSENVPPSVPPVSQRPSQRVSRDSRGRSARESRPVPSRPVPSESLHEEKRARRPDVDALRKRLGKVTKDQRRVLDEIAERHQRDGNDGGWFAYEAIEAAVGTDPLQAAMTADRMWQESQRRKADADEKAWAETKAGEKADAERIVGSSSPW